MKDFRFYITIVALMISYSVTEGQSLKLSDLDVSNRNASAYNKDGRKAVELDANDGDGLAVLKTEKFETGTIEIELRGENNPGKSFIGIAFNIQDDETYEAVYFRPFNFVAEEQIRKEHMVQYIFHPEYTWRKLRTEREGEFEAEIKSPPNPDDWFTATIKITTDRVQVFIQNESEPILDVPRLTTIKSRKIGLWVGHGSSGRFDNLKLNRN
jgi:hypothetical protein